MISSKCRIFSEVSENRAGYAATVWEPRELREPRELCILKLKTGGRGWVREEK